MGYKPLQECKYRGEDYTCTHPEIGEKKLLWMKLGNRQCFLVSQSKALTCSVAEPIPGKTLPPPALPSKRVGGKIDVTIPVVNVSETSAFKYQCKHRHANGDCSKINLTATYGSQKCIYTVDRFNLGECGYHDNFKPHDATNVLNTNAIDMSTPVVVPKGVYNCHLNPCHLEKISEDSYECDHCGCQITNAKKKLRGGFSC